MASDNNIHEHHHHHHHHHHSMDASEEFKRSQFRSQKIRKVLSKVMMAILTIVAICVMLAVFYVYTN